ncbi:MAG: 4Fe-4S binding protein [Aureliella sp.]
MSQSPPELQVLEPAQIATPGVRARALLQLWRFGVFCSIIAMINLQHRQYTSQQSVRLSDDQQASWQLAEIRKRRPEVQSIASASLGGIECIQLLDAETNAVGYAAFTLPIASDTLGFSGPTNTLLLFSTDGNLISATICDSADTRDHVDSIKQDPEFLPSLTGKSADELSRVTVDGVSGATLTSLAIVESIRLRCSSQAPTAAPTFSFESLKFPRRITTDDLSTHFAKLSSIHKNESTGLYDLLDGNNNTIGHLLRLSPAADNIVGYQGPTDGLLLLSTDNFATRLVVLGSYDNEPYTDYVSEDDYFCNLFSGFSIGELAKLDAERIEGVSGATMTSQSVAAGVVQAASVLDTFQQELADYSPPPAVPGSDSQSLTVRDISTMIITAVGCLLALTRLKRRKTVRFLFQIVLIVWLGLINGDMISQALWLGWAQHGIHWQNALGLLALSAAALFIPLATGQNAYCAHLCPHGAVQQLTRGRLKWRLKLSRRIQKTLKIIPVALLFLVGAIGLLHLPISPVDLEPFDAWIWKVAGIASISIAIVGIAFSFIVPMGYCRFGCPTGLLLNSFRRAGPRWSKQDTVAGLFLLLSCVMSLLC